MGFFSQQQQQETVRIDGENTVTVRRLSYGEAQDVLSRSTVMDLITKDARFDFAENQVLKLQVAIVAWDGPGFEGRPVTLENIKALPAEVGALIAEAVERINKRMTETEQKNSPAPTSA